MSEENIYLLTGPVQSGKTSALSKWAEEKSDLGGFLTPVQHGIRKFIFLLTGSIYTLEKRADFRSDDIIVGKYRFDHEVFQLGKGIILTAFYCNYDYVIIDELGKLEMENKGFEPELSNLIHHYQSASTSSKLILVVRESLLKSVIDKYRFRKVNIITIDTLHEI